MSLAARSQHIDFTSLIDRSRAIRATSRRLRERAAVIRRRSLRLCPRPIFGASDAREAEAVPDSARSNGRPRPEQDRRSVLVIAADAMTRAFIGDAISADHDVAEASDVAAAVKVVASGPRVDVIVAGGFLLGEAGALPPWAGVARELYDCCPWIPVIVIADRRPAMFNADVVLTGIQALLPKDFTPAELAAIVTRVARRPDAPLPGADRVTAVKQAVAVLEQSMTDMPPLKALATMAGMSRSHFSRTFHAVAGVTLRNYVRDLRLKRALLLIRDSPRLSLTSIAVAAGFYDLPHFNKAFRDRVGLSPGRFRLASRSSSPPSAPA